MQQYYQPHKRIEGGYVNQAGNTGAATVNGTWPSI